MPPTGRRPDRLGGRLDRRQALQGRSPAPGFSLKRQRRNSIQRGRLFGDFVPAFLFLFFIFREVRGEVSGCGGVGGGGGKVREGVWF